MECISKLIKESKVNILDITGNIKPGMWSYGPDVTSQMEGEEVSTAPVFKKLAERKMQGWEASKVELTTLTGTYLETGAHLFEGFPTIDQLPPEQFFKSAVVVEIPKDDGEAVTSVDIQQALKFDIYPGDAVIVNTGWHKNWEMDTFADKGPYFSVDALDLLISKDISLLASDMARFNHDSNSENVVAKLLKSGALLLAPVVNLNAVGTKRCNLIVMPLKLSGLCASPCRALLFYD